MGTGFTLHIYDQPLKDKIAFIKKWGIRLSYKRYSLEKEYLFRQGLKRFINECYNLVNDEGFIEDIFR